MIEEKEIINKANETAPDKIEAVKAKKEKDKYLTIELTEPTKINNQDELDLKIKEHSKWISDTLNPRSKSLSGRANLENADLREFSFEGVNLSGANLRAANLAGVNLSGANLSAANLSNANLSKADLSFAKLTRAQIKNANFENAILNDTNFDKTDIKNAHFSQQNDDTLQKDIETSTNTEPEPNTTTDIEIDNDNSTILEPNEQIH